MNILQINKFHYLNGGSERHYFDLIKLLEQKNYKVISFSTNDSRNNYSKYSKYFISKISLENFNLKNILNIFYNSEANSKLKQLIKNEKPDIAHLHNVYHQIPLSIARILKKNNIPIVLTLHDYKLICPNYKLFNKNKECHQCEGNKFYKCFTNKCVKNSYSKSFLSMLESYYHTKITKAHNYIDLFIAPSIFMKQICVKYGLPEHKIIVMNNFVNNSLPTHQEQELKKYKKPEYILYFGRLSKEKGVDLLVNAFKNTKKNLELKIVGTGPLHKELVKLTLKKSLANKIKILGPKYGLSLKKIIFDAKAVVVPSIWPENMPLAILEAMLMQKVVIASQIGGIPEIIENGKNGFLFKAGSKNKLLKIINNLDNYNLAEISKNAKQKATLFNKQKYCNQLIMQYKNIIPKK